jgi:hypothetical protein
MAVVPPVTAVAPSQPVSPILASDGAWDGPLLQARVTAMLSETLARLSIEGHTVDVVTPKPLPVGATIPLRGEWKDGQLRLFAEDAARAPSTAASQSAPMPQAPAAPSVRTSIAFPIGEPAMPLAAPAPTSTLPQPAGVTAPAATPAQAAPTTPQQIVAELSRYQPPLPSGPAAAPATAVPTAPNTLAPVRTALAHIQAMAVEAMLSGIGAQEAAEGHRPAAAASTQADPAMRQPFPEAAAPRAQAAAMQLAAGQQQAMAERHATAAERATADRIAGGATDAPPPDAPRPDRVTTATVQLPLYLPGSEMPIRLQITRERHDDGEAGGERSEREPSWIVRFSSQTGRLGPIHAAISLVDGHVGVQLWAERDDTAEWFRSHSDQLRDALIASDVELDAVRIAHGSPLSPQEG